MVKWEVTVSASAWAYSADKNKCHHCQHFVIEVGLGGVNDVGMYVKVFEQILDSSIADNYEVRHFFEDLLKLADREGVVDMTPEAIARRINLPVEKVKPLLVELEKPDPASRSRVEDGKRIVRLDGYRDWGWTIVNYEHYRSIRNDEDRRRANREAQQRHRAKEKKPSKGHQGGKGSNGEMITREETQESVSGHYPKGPSVLCPDCGHPTLKMSPVSTCRNHPAF